MLGTATDQGDLDHDKMTHDEIISLAERLGMKLPGDQLDPHGHLPWQVDVGSRKSNAQMPDTGEDNSEDDSPTQPGTSVPAECGEYTSEDDSPKPETNPPSEGGDESFWKVKSRPSWPALVACAKWAATEVQDRAEESLFPFMWKHWAKRDIYWEYWCAGLLLVLRCLALDGLWKPLVVLGAKEVLADPAAECTANVMGTRTSENISGVEEEEAVLEPNTRTVGVQQVVTDLSNSFADLAEEYTEIAPLTSAAVSVAGPVILNISPVPVLPLRDHSPAAVRRTPRSPESSHMIRRTKQSPQSVRLVEKLATSELHTDHELSALQTATDRAPGPPETPPPMRSYTWSPSAGRASPPVTPTVSPEPVSLALRETARRNQEIYQYKKAFEKLQAEMAVVKSVNVELLGHERELSRELEAELSGHLPPMPLLDSESEEEDGWKPGRFIDKSPRRAMDFADQIHSDIDTDRFATDQVAAHTHRLQCIHDERLKAAEVKHQKKTAHLLKTINVWEHKWEKEMEKKHQVKDELSRLVKEGKLQL